MSVTLLRKINKAANDPNHFDNNYLGEVLEEAYIFIEQLKKENEKLRNESKRLVVGFRTINRRSSHHVPESITGDDEPCYWQRKEWIDYIFELCENVEALLTKQIGE